MATDSMVRRKVRANSIKEVAAHLPLCVENIKFTRDDVRGNCYDSLFKSTGHSS